MALLLDKIDAASGKPIKNGESKFYELYTRTILMLQRTFYSSRFPQKHLLTREKCQISCDARLNLSNVLQPISVINEANKSRL